MRFTAELIEGHKGVTVVIVPFDPEATWGPPVRLAGRRHGWPVAATVNRVAFPSYVGERWGRFFIILDDAVRTRAKLAIGDAVRISAKPDAKALATAIELSKRTTQPKTARVLTGTPSVAAARRRAASRP